MPRKPRSEELPSPNSAIDEGFAALLKRCKDEKAAIEVYVKVLAAAAMWEKVKHGIQDAEEPDITDPDEL